jgi:C4-dicarboxylate transporter, DctQ subunit
MQFRFVEKMEEGILSLLLASMTLLVFMEVVMRFVFNTGLLWAEELTLLLSAWMVLLGASYGIKKGTHIGVDALVRTFPDGLRRVVAIITAVLCVAYCGLFIYGAWGYLSLMHMIGIELEDMAIPRWIGHSILLIGFALLALRLIQLIVRLIQGKSKGFELMDEAKDSMQLAQGSGEKSNEPAEDKAS